MADIKEKVENKTKTIETMYESMENAIKHQIDGGLDKVNTHELYEAIDILKDLSEIKLNCVKAMYKTQIMEAMEDSEYGVDYDENGEIRYYRGQPRSKTSGRFMSRGDGRRNYRMTPEMYREYEPEYYRDLDRESMKRMYSTTSTGTSGSSRNYSDGYADGMNEGEKRGYNNGMSEGETRGYERGFSEGSRNRGGRYDRARRNYEENKQGKNGQSDEKDMRNLETMLNEFEKELSEMLPKMSQQEKNLAKNKVVSWQNKVQ